METIPLYKNILSGDCVKNIYRYGFCLLFGAVVYPLLEIWWRGYTHFSMALLGGLCFSFIYFVNSRYRHRRVTFRAFLCCMFITVMEFSFGVVLNLVLRLDVWDYSGVYGNLFGQICLFYCVVWYLLSLLCTPLCALIRKAGA